MRRRNFCSGDLVIYRKPKYSVCPGPRARDIQPAKCGDTYAYRVDKFWVVVDLDGDNRVLVRTRRGKSHFIDAGDTNLRRASWIERLWYRHRFPSVASTHSTAPVHQH